MPTQTTQFTIETIDDSGSVLGQSSLALDGSGEPAVAYVVERSDRLTVKVARRTSNGQWTHEDTGANPLPDNVRIGIGIDSRNVPHIAYRDDTTDHAIHAGKTDDGSWSFDQIPTLLGGGANNVSMQLNPGKDDPPSVDVPSVAFRDGIDSDRLHVAIKRGGSWQVSKVDPASSDTKAGVSLAFDHFGTLRIAYFHGIDHGQVSSPIEEPLKLAQELPTVQGDPTPPAFGVRMLDESSVAAESVSLARDLFFGVFVAYADHLKRDVKAYVNTDDSLPPAIELVAPGNGHFGPRRPSAAAKPGQNFFIAYLEDGQVMLAERTHGSWSSQPVATGDGWPSLAFGKDGIAHLTYGTGTLQYARSTTSPA